ncbi:hypothetical protein IU485_28450 [Nocardia cyriacigeorgica]|uniref:hypothetical protein n=1 Tax=Nocardia cyriacigeorgica TaxID=135487 RepID=UPI001892EA4C|nr:hypothetical protein [Nocardia cyriacigeorgica]MBF6085305.1 hypothetical protein [Nocardia cyriacigeorgica]
MEMAPALGYIRTDISGVRQRWEETQMRSLAKRLGYNLTKTVALSKATDDPVGLLLGQIARSKAEAVFVPALAHLAGDHERVISRADVIVSADEVYARWPPLARLLNGETDPR